MTRTREIVDVTYKVGDKIVTERFNTYWVEYSAGNLIIHDNGIAAAFGPGVWLTVKTVDPEEEQVTAPTPPPPAATE